MKLPTIEPRGALTRAPQSSVSGADVANVYGQIGAAFDAVGQTLQAKAQDDARIAGQNAVYTDENGNPKVDLKPNLSERNRIYNRTATQALMSRLAPEIRTAAARMAREANGDIGVFEPGWKGFRDRMMTNVDRELRGPVEAMLNEAGSLQLEGIKEQKFRSDMQSAKREMLSERNYLMDTAASLAMQGGHDTPEFNATLAKINSLNDELSGNPVFAYSPREAEIEMKSFSGRVKAESMIGEIDRAVETGGIVEALKIRDRFRSEVPEGVSPADARTYYGIANARIEGYQAQKKAVLKGVIDEAKKVEKGLEAGTVDVNSTDIPRLATELSRAGDPGAGLNLLAARRKKIFADATNAQQVDMAERAYGERMRPSPSRYNRPVSFSPDMSSNMQSAMNHYIARGIPATMAAGIVGNLVQESGLNPNARNRGDGNDGSDSIGIGQWNGNRARALKAFAASQGASPFDLATQLDFVLHELETTEGAAYQRLKSAKTVDEATAAMIGFERPRGWSAANPRGGHGWGNRLAAAMKAAEIKGLKGEALAVSGDFPVTDDEAKAMSTEFASDVRAIIPDIEAGIKSGLPFESDKLDLLTRQMVFVNDQDLRSQVADMLERNSQILAAQSAPLEEVEAAIGVLRSDMSKNGATATKLALAEGLEASAKAKRQALDNDAIGYGQSQGLVGEMPAIDMQNPSSYASTLQQFQRGVDVMQATGQVANISAFRPAQEDAYALMWQTAAPEQLSAMTNAMASSLSPETLRATLTHGEAKNALGGAAMSSNPAIHAEAMKQLDILSVNTPMTDIEATFGKDVTDRLQDWQGRVRYFTAEETAKWLQQRNDPKWLERVKPLISAGEKEARKVPASEVISLLDTNSFWDAQGPRDDLTERMMLNDFTSLMGERNGSLDDVGKAKQQAVERMKKTWGVTSVYGDRAGRLMPYPPEQFYPAVGNSHRWMELELQEVAAARSLPVDSLSLVADRKTQDAAMRGEAPGYLISVIDPETGMEELMTDENGNHLRQFFDPASAQRRETSAASELRMSRDHRWRSSDPQERGKSDLIWGLIGQATKFPAEIERDLKAGEN